MLGPRPPQINPDQSSDEEQSPVKFQHCGKQRTPLTHTAHAESDASEPEDSETSAEDSEDDEITDDTDDEDERLAQMESNPKALEKLLASEAVQWHDDPNPPQSSPHPYSRDMQSSRKPRNTTLTGAQPVQVKKRGIRDTSDLDGIQEGPVSVLSAAHVPVLSLLLHPSEEGSPCRRAGPTQAHLGDSSADEAADMDLQAPLRKAHANVKGKTKAVKANTDSGSEDSGIELVLPQKGKLKLKEQHGRVRRVLNRSIDLVLADICLHNAFPETAQDHVKVAYRALIKAADELDDKDIVRRLKKRDNYALELTKVPSQRIPTFRGTIRRLVEGLPMTAFKLKFGDEEKGNWLQEEYRFINDFDWEARTIFEGKPFSNPVFVETLRMALFKNPEAFGFELSKQFQLTLLEKPEELEVPAPMLALVTTALYSAIEDWKNGNAQPRDFTANNYLGAYRDIIRELSHVRETAPVKYHVLMHGLWRRISDPFATRRGSAAPSHRGFLNAAAMPDHED
ncbi:hypothetical protein C8Q77DRAFT_1214291 [Trametes polyzona]|nr:hypothetical protein C8Q77DRAFT_1214291 [Trametes polyzona]